MSTINLKSKMPDKNPPRKNHKFKRHNIKSKLDEDSIIIYAKEIILIDPDEDYEKKTHNSLSKCVRVSRNNLERCNIKKSYIFFLIKLLFFIYKNTKHLSQIYNLLLIWEYQNAVARRLFFFYRRPTDLRFYEIISHRYFPVRLSAVSAIFLGKPVATICPPALPPPGPISTT